MRNRVQNKKVALAKFLNISSNRKNYKTECCFRLD